MKKLFTLFLLVFLPFVLFAQDPSKLVHNSTYYVDDYAKIFTTDQVIKLDKTIRSFFDTVQISIVTVKSLEGYDPIEYAVKVGNNFGVGSISNNGLIILIAPNDRKIAMATGPGISGDMTDLLSKRLIDKYAISSFKSGDFYTGTYNLLSQSINELSPSAKELRRVQELKENEKAKEFFYNVVQYTLILLLVALIIFSIIYFYKQHLKKRKELFSLYNKALDNYNDYCDIILKYARYNMYPISNLVKFKIDSNLSISKLKKETLLLNEKRISLVEMYDEFIKKCDKIESYLSDLRILKKEISEHKEYKNSSLVFGDVEMLNSNIKKYNHVLEITKNALDVCNIDINNKSYDKLSQNLTLIKGTYMPLLNSTKKSISVAIYDDAMETKKALGGKDTILDMCKNLLTYCVAPNGTTEIINVTISRINSVLEKAKAFDKVGMTIIQKSTLLKMLLNELVFCNGPKKEYEKIVAEKKKVEEQKRREEEERLRREREEENKKRREQEEEERRRSSYSSSSYTSFGSSSSSSSSTFGGGTFDGGGSQSSW